MNSKKLFIVFALLVVCIGLGSAQAFAGAPYVPVFNTNSNLTLIDATGATIGGGNDIWFTWDGTVKTSVAVSGQVANATLSAYSKTFTGMPSGTKWTAHDVAVYGPGTYTVKASCAAKAPGCATGTNPITFTVGAGQLGAHMLIDYGTVSTNKNIDVVNVWSPGVFSPSTMSTGLPGSNPASRFWDLMSTPAPATPTINGYPTLDGPSIGSRWNFNLSGSPLAGTPLNMIVDTANNNFTMIDSMGSTFGGANDVRFTWDGTRKTSVAASGQVANATLSFTCPFFGRTWLTHDVAIYAPGTYTIYDGCQAGSPGCGTGNAVTFTVNSGELGAHMLFYWGSDDSDIVDVWQPNQVFGPSVMNSDPLGFVGCGFSYGCGSNPCTKVWDHMSYDWDLDGINGAPMTGGDLAGNNANFNVMGKIGCVSDADCNDNDVCTTDACDRSTGNCRYTSIVCDDGNLCTIDTCDPATGACVFTPRVCNDNNACTTDSCNPASGCVFTPIDVAAVCNDNNACTTDTCDPATGCVHSTIDCDDNNACTTDTCGPATGCVHTAIVCNDNNACTADSCNPATGCVYTPNVVCTDNNPCMTAACNPATGSCVSIPRACNDGNPCTTDTCDTATGNCVFTPLSGCIVSGPPYVPVFNTNSNLTLVNATGGTIGGGNDIWFTWDGTVKTAVAVSGQVPNATLGSYSKVYTGIPSGTRWTAHDVAVYGPGTYTVKASCAAKAPGCATGTNPITFTVGAGQLGAHMLVDYGTVSTNKNIDVVNVWTAGVFSPSAMYTGPVGSNSASRVWDLMSTPAPATPTINGYPTVDGPNIGTRWNFNLSGSPLAGTPINMVVDTTNNNFTMVDSWGATFGGTNDIRFTWDGTKKTSVAASGQVANASFFSTCAFFGGTWAAHDMAVYGPGTYTIFADCPAGSPGCAAGTNAVTFTVAPGELGAHMLFYWGGSDNIAVVDVWQPNQVFGPSVMNDNTPDGLVYGCGTNPLSRVWNWMSYDWDQDGINGGPMPNGPFAGANANFSVMGGKVCVSDADCSDNNNACITGVCDIPTGYCRYTSIVCDDGNKCTIDTCDPATGACVFTPRVCNDNNACTTDSCYPATGCSYTPIICNDHNACTSDWCSQATGCFYSPVNCNDNNACTTDTCDPATGCVHTPIICNDNNACTTDSCNPSTGCVFTPIVCNDNNACTDDACDPAIGCVFTNNAAPCNDNNACTMNDVCSNGACAGTPKVCISPAATCNPAIGGVCTPANSLGNNFTLLAPNGWVMRGTNDVKFTWDGTLQSAATFSNGTGLSNATISSDEPLSGWLWYAKNVQVVGPGTYWVDLDGSGPGTNRYEVTIPNGQIGAHMLLDWGPTGQATSCDKTDCDVDVWVAWAIDQAFASGKLFTGADDGVNTNAPALDDPPVNSLLDGRPNASDKVWDLVSVDLAGRITNSTGTTITNLPLDGVPGIKMMEGTYKGSNFNFNVMLEDLCADAATRCNDNNACTADSCNPTTGACSHAAVVCDDGNLCTTDTCNPATGCIYTPKNVEDNNACTDDFCNMQGRAIHPAINCDDNNVCTTDTCNPATGCVHTNNTAACTDNNACTAGDHCSGGACISGTPEVCPVGACNSSTGCSVSNANTSGNNMTIILPTGLIYRGTNDVKFTWDGTRQNVAAFANGTGPSNATISSDEPLNSWLWYAKHVQVVGPGIYWTDLDGVGPSLWRYEVTIPAGRIGAHMLLDWGETGQATSCGKTDCDVDVWIAWDFNNAFMTGKLFTGADDGTNCNQSSDVPPVNSLCDGQPNAGTKVWDLVSVDVAGRVTTPTGAQILNLPLDNVPGLRVQEGNFKVMSINFNMMVQ